MTDADEEKGTMVPDKARDERDLRLVSISFDLEPGPYGGIPEAVEEKEGEAQ